MPVNYSEVLLEFDQQIKGLETELETLRAGRAAIALMQSKAKSFPAASNLQFSAAIIPPRGKYADMGTTAAIRDVLADGELRTRDEVFNALRAGGWTTNAGNALSTISATLAQAADIEKVEDRFRKRRSIQAPKFYGGGSVMLAHPDSDHSQVPDWETSEQTQPV